MEDGGFCGGAARCGCGVFLRLPPPATTETTLGNPPRPLFSSPPQPAARLFHAAATAACPHGTQLVGGWFFQAVGKNLAGSLSRRSPGTLFLSLSFHCCAHCLPQDRRRRVPDDTPADDDSRTTRTSRCLPDSVVVVPDDGGSAGCSGGDEFPEMNLGTAYHRAA